MTKENPSSKAVKASTRSWTSAAVDPTIASLFDTSSGPVSAPVRLVSTRVTKSATQDLNDQHDTEQSIVDEAEPTSSESTEPEDEAEEPESRPRKRRRLSEEEDIEAAYLNKLAKEEQKEDSERMKMKAGSPNTLAGDEDQVDDSDDTASSASNDLDDLSDLEPEDEIPQHESLTKGDTDYEKTRRTVFLGNVSTEAIKSRTARKELENHLKSVLDSDKEKIESLRFRSTAFNVTAGPKKAAYAKKDLMDETTKSTNAYIVLSSEAAAKKVGKKLNGTVVLDRHLHTDWLAHPTPIEHKRCLFVGNLTFVDLESNVDTNKEGDQEKRRPRSKEPADAEEGLWRAFSKFGTVESVRVIRDKTTRVGKGFAYVQLSDEIATEKALALDGKKFPPMLPRLLRVSRAKRILKKDLKRNREDDKNDNGPSPSAHRATNPRSRTSGPVAKTKALNGIVFEGYRASADKGLKFKSKAKKGKKGVKPTTRSSRRGAAFKAGGGKKKRDA